MTKMPRIKKFLIWQISSEAFRKPWFKLMYIWIADFKRFTLDLEGAEKTGGPKPNLFDCMNVKKHYPLDDNSTFQRTMINL